MLRNAATGLTIQSLTGLTATTWTPSANLAVGNYRWWVQAVGPNGQAANWSAATDFHVGGAARFTNPASSYGPTPTFTWQTVDGAGRYELQINRVDVPQTNVVRESNLTGNSFTVPFNLVSGGTYRAWIRAISSTGELGPWSSALNFTVASADNLDWPEPIGQIDELMAELLPVLFGEGDIFRRPATNHEAYVRLDVAHTDLAEPSLHPQRGQTEFIHAADAELDQMIDMIIGDLLMPPEMHLQKDQI